MNEQEATTAEQNTNALQEDNANSNSSSDLDASHYEEEKKEDLSIASFRSENELYSTAHPEKEIIPMDDDDDDDEPASIMMSGIGQFLDNKETHLNFGDDASVDMSVVSDATFRLGRQMGKF